MIILILGVFLKKSMKKRGKKGHPAVFYVTFWLIRGKNRKENERFIRKRRGHLGSNTCPVPSEAPYREKRTGVKFALFLFPLLGI